MEAVSSLLLNGVDVNQEYEGMTPAVLAVYAGRADLLQALLDAGGNPMHPQMSHARQWAFRRGYADVLSVLKERGGISSAGEGSTPSSAVRTNLWPFAR